MCVFFFVVCQRADKLVVCLFAIEDVGRSRALIDFLNNHLFIINF